MAAQLIDGKAIAAGLRSNIATAATEFSSTWQRPPGLAVVLVGDDPASQVYVRNKKIQAANCGFFSTSQVFDASISQAELLQYIDGLNKDPAIDGILVQLPLPGHINPQAVIRAIDPARDVDGFHPINTGLLYQGTPALVPCTPLGCLHLLHSVHAQLDGMSALVIGRSNIVGRPLAALLLNHNATVTIAHSRSRDLPAMARSAQLVLVAAGQPLLVQPNWIAPGATVIDIGIHRQSNADGGPRLVGDVDPGVAQVAGHLTPVPGGVGPMTIACLLSNTLQAASARMAGSTTDRLKQNS